MSEQPHENSWTDPEDLDELFEDPDSIVKMITFLFRFNPAYSDLPFSISTKPEFDQIDDVSILMLISTGIRVLAKRHGLDEALRYVNDIAYGKIGGEQVFKMTTPKDT